MTAPSDRTVNYLCPQCQARLSANPSDAGQRQECPKCGKQVKVPGQRNRPATRPAGSRHEDAGPKDTGPRNTGPDNTDQRTRPSRGLADIPVICPLCGTRLHATLQQAGHEIVCPDCLESVQVPHMEPPRSVASTSTAPLLPDDAEAPSASTDDRQQDDELKLSEPVDLKAVSQLPKELSDFMDPGGSGDPLADDALPVPTPGDATSGTTEVNDDSGKRNKTERPKRPSEFAIKCPVCDTRLYTTEKKIGHKIACPDCYSPIEVRRPAPKPRKVNPVVESESGGESFTLSEPVDRSVYLRAKDGDSPQTIGQEAMERAQRQAEEREEQEPDIPVTPLWNNVFKFLPDTSVVGRLVLAAGLTGGALNALLSSILWAQQASAQTQFAALAGSVLTVILTAIALPLLAVSSLTILQATADGYDRIPEWPELGIIDWLIESMSVAISVFYSTMPGLLLFWSAQSMGISTNVAWLFLGVSLYMFYPIVLLSVLESGSLTNLYSPPIMRSLRSRTLLWMTFYLISLAIALIVAIVISMLDSETTTLALFGVGAIGSFAAFLYHRFLGRLAMACDLPAIDGDTKERAEIRERPDGRE